VVGSTVASSSRNNDKKASLITMSSEDGQSGRTERVLWRWGRAPFLEFDEDRVASCVAHVSALMFLGVEPSHLATVKFHGYLAATGHDHSLEGR
jgi:hypothetical protein